jgi:hypothetical protein
MAAHKGPASLRPRCTWSGSSAAAIPMYHLCIIKSRHAVKCQILTFLPFPTKCIWRVGIQDRSRNGDQEVEIFRLPPSLVITPNIGSALNPAKCCIVISCVVLCRVSQLVGRKLLSTRLDCAGNEPYPLGRGTIISVRTVFLPQCENGFEITELLFCVS